MSLRCIEDFGSPQHICRQALWLEIYVIVHNILLVDKLIGYQPNVTVSFSQP